MINDYENVLESVIETYLKEQVKALGGLAYKFRSTVNGVPDQLIIHKGKMYLVEVKRPNEKPRPLQVRVHEDIRAREVEVYVVDTKQSIDTWIRDTLGEKPVNLTTHKQKQNKKTVIKDITSFDI